EHRRERHRDRVLERARSVAASPDEAERRAADVDRFVASMPDRYLLANTPEAIVAHAALWSSHGSQDVSVALGPSPFPGVAEIAVVAADRPGLLAAVTAALSGARLHVHAAQIHSRGGAASGSDEPVQAVDLFWVRARHGGVEAVASRMPRLRRDLAAVLAGDAEPQALARLTRSAGAGQPAVPTKVVLDNRAAQEHTVVEVFTRDRAGLLFTLAHAMFGLGLSIALAKINTEGDRAIDVFYVHDRGATKVCLDERGEELRKALVDAVEAMDEAREES
ncbi:MAG: hypothetical protein JRI23_00005, partial [Deltaproteobacteria bacterium]|nr:hypothetical protein [Deltaproteobacteria bacterium]MBW2529825.1 hypothetical protein [Deltaproteobacteria bacterium]